MYKPNTKNVNITSLGKVEVKGKRKYVDFTITHPYGKHHSTKRFNNHLEGNDPIEQLDDCETDSSHVRLSTLVYQCERLIQILEGVNITARIDDPNQDDYYTFDDYFTQNPLSFARMIISPFLDEVGIPVEERAAKSIAYATVLCSE